MKFINKLIFTFFLLFCCFANISDAKTLSKIDKIIKTTGLVDSSVISVSVREADTNEVVYEYNEKKLLHPASTLKVFTVAAALDSLPPGYSFKTALYKDVSNNLYIKLGADPMLTKDGLKDLVKQLRAQSLKSFNNIYFDDSIMDRQEWGTGWMWDDDTNSRTPKFSAYNLDNNVIRLSLSKAQNGDVVLTPSSKYLTSVVNCLEWAKDTKFNSIRYNWVNPEIVELNGVVASPMTIDVPISSMRRYFIYTITDLFKNYNIKFASTSFASKQVPSNAKKVAEILTPVDSVLPSILQNSNNKNAETLIRVAAFEKYAKTSSSFLISQLFNEYWKSNDIDTSAVVMVDGSGVSRNNILSADWMTLALGKLYKSPLYETLKVNMAQPGDGTLSTRMFDLRGDVFLKTGSLSNISGITGFVTDKRGKTYTVAVLIQNFVCSPKDIKLLEDKIITLIAE